MGHGHLSTHVVGLCGIGQLSRVVPQWILDLFSGGSSGSLCHHCYISPHHPIVVLDDEGMIDRAADVDVGWCRVCRHG